MPENAINACIFLKEKLKPLIFFIFFRPGIFLRMRCGEKNSKGTSGRELALDSDSAAVGSYNPLHHRKSETEMAVSGSGGISTIKAFPDMGEYLF